MACDVLETHHHFDDTALRGHSLCARQVNVCDQRYRSPHLIPPSSHLIMWVFIIFMYGLGNRDPQEMSNLPKVIGKKMTEPTRFEPKPDPCSFQTSTLSPQQAPSLYLRLCVVTSTHCIK